MSRSADGFFAFLAGPATIVAEMPKLSSSRALARVPARLAPSPAPRPVLRGELDRVGLSTVLTILEMERQTGLLVVKRGRQAVRIEVREGQVIRARFDGARQPTGAEAVYLALGWPDGQFQLFGAKVAGRDEVGMRTTFLLMEGLRRLDEARGGPVSAADDGDFLAAL
jgi:hypothetical protein